MAVGQGYRAYCSLGKDNAAWGTYQAPTDFFEFASEGIKKTVQEILSTGINGSRWGTKRVQGAVKVEGPIKFSPNVDDAIGLLLKYSLHAEAYTAKETGTVGEHIFTASDSFPTLGLCLEIGRDATVDAANVWGASGGYVKKLSLKGSAGNLLDCDADLVFKDMVSGKAAQVPAYSTKNPLVFHTGTFTIGGTPVQFQDFSLDIAQGLHADRMALGTPYIIQPTPGPLDITGSFTVPFDAMTLITAYLAGTSPGAISVDFTSGVVGATTLRLKIDLATVYLNGETPTIGGPDEQKLTIPFRSLAATGANLCTATLVNSVASAY